MVLALYRKRKDVKGFLKHMVYIAEKAEKSLFDPAALNAYDECIKEVARECGSKSFEKVGPAAIVKHLSYDGTVAAQNNAKSSAAKKPAPFKSGGKPTSGICLKHVTKSSPSLSPLGPILVSFERQADQDLIYRKRMELRKTAD